MRLPIAILALLSLCSFSSAQVEVESPPMGGNVISISSGNSLLAPSFVHPDSFNGSISQFVDQGNGQWVISFVNPGFLTNQFDAANYPLYYLEVKSPGTYQGAYYDIISSTTNSVTVEGVQSGSLSIGMEICIRKHFTIEDFFKAAEGSIIPGTIFLQFFYNNNLAIPLFWTGSFWTSDFVTNDNNLPIYPGQGFLGSFGQPYTFAVSGYVKQTPTIVPIYNNGINLVGTISPVNLTFTDLNPLDQMRQGQDILVTYQNGASLSINKVYFHGGDKFTSDFLNDEQTDPVPANLPFVVSAGSDFNWILPSPIN